MKTIWKYDFATKDEFELFMPIDAKILSLQMQFDTPCLWAEVDSEAEKIVRRFQVFGTGHEVQTGIGYNLDYIGTYQLHAGELIFHLYERR